MFCNCTCLTKLESALSLCHTFFLSQTHLLINYIFFSVFRPPNAIRFAVLICHRLRKMLACTCLRWFYELFNQNEKRDTGGMNERRDEGIMLNTLEMRRHGQEIHFMHYALCQRSSSTGFAFFLVPYAFGTI